VSFDSSAVDAQREALEKHGTPLQTRARVLPWRRIVAPRFRAAPVYVTVRDRSTGKKFSSGHFSFPQIVEPERLASVYVGNLPCLLRSPSAAHLH
jgi:hypothetical protein